MQGERQGERLNSSSPIRFEDLVPDIRRRKVVFSIVRSLAFITLIVVAYFTLPLTRRIGPGPIAALVIGMIVVAVALTLQIRATMRSPHPGIRAFESLASSGPLFLILFAATHFLIGHNSAHSYSQTMTRLDALYFTLTVFTTVGFGDIAPVSELARTVTMLQMIGDVLLIFVIARVLFGAVKVGIARRSSRSPSETSPRPAAPASHSPEGDRSTDG